MNEQLAALIEWARAAGPVPHEIRRATIFIYNGQVGGVTIDEIACLSDASTDWYVKSGHLDGCSCAECYKLNR